MTAKQENLFSMFNVLSGYLSTRQSVVNSVPAFQRAYEKLQTLISEIRKAENIKQIPLSGKTEIKSSLKNELGSATFLLASALYTYADENNLHEIRERVDKNESYFKRMRDKSLVVEAQELIELTEGIEGTLSDYGLRIEEINELSSLISSFENLVDENDSNENDNNNALSQNSVYKLIGQAKDIIDHQLDKHTERLKYSNTEFYSQYFAARRVADNGYQKEKAEIMRK